MGTFVFEIWFLDHLDQILHLGSYYLYFFKICIFRLVIYVYEYLQHSGATRAAQTFLSEVKTHFVHGSLNNNNKHSIYRTNIQTFCFYLRKMINRLFSSIACSAFSYILLDTMGEEYDIRRSTWIFAKLVVVSKILFDSKI